MFAQSLLSFVLLAGITATNAISIGHVERIHPRFPGQPQVWGGDNNKRGGGDSGHGGPGGFGGHGGSGGFSGHGGPGGKGGHGGNPGSGSTSIKASATSTSGESMAPASTTASSAPSQPTGGPGTCSGGQQVKNDACCVMFDIQKEMQDKLFDNGQCGEFAHEAIRLAFHDAIGFSNSMGAAGGGGADGSIMTFSDTELTYAANSDQIDEIVLALKDIQANFNVSAGDFIQYSAAVATSNCPGTPQLEFWMGRPAATMAAPDKLIPAPFQSVDDILARMADANFSPEELIAMLAAHSVGAADVIDPTVPGSPFDSTPSTFDTQVFVEVLLNGTTFPGTANNSGEVASPLQGEIRIASDALLARDSRTACTWQSYVNNQQKMMDDFKTAMLKLSLVGQNKNDLIDCSDTVPTSQSFNKPAYFPAGTDINDVEHSCDSTPFPELQTDSSVTSVAPVNVPSGPSRK